METLFLLFSATISIILLYLLYKMQKKQNNLQNEIDLEQRVLAAEAKGVNI
jgi:hypothetical protein